LDVVSQLGYLPPEFTDLRRDLATIPEVGRSAAPDEHRDVYEDRDNDGRDHHVCRPSLHEKTSRVSRYT
jgi:hypothetical protein